MSKTILLVDDEAIVVEIARRKLEEAGFNVMVASNGVKAFEQLKNAVPDLIVLDIQMEDMNGYSFIMEKDKIPAYVTIPVIILTAHPETEPLFKRHGIKAYLLKPLKLPDLVHRIVDVIGRP